MDIKSKNTNKTIYKNLLVKLRRIEISISTVCIIGIFLCLYALKVELYKEKDSNYKALCDFSEWISCSKVFTSKYGKGFGLVAGDSVLNQPNTIYGIIFYIIQLLSLLLRKNTNAIKLKLGLSVLSNIGSIYLAYVLYFILKDFCIVCVSTYILNFILLVLNLFHYKYFKHIKIVSSELKKSN